MFLYAYLDVTSQIYQRNESYLNCTVASMQREKATFKAAFDSRKFPSYLLFTSRSTSQPSLQTKHTRGSTLVTFTHSAFTIFYISCLICFNSTFYWKQTQILFTEEEKT